MRIALAHWKARLLFRNYSRFSPFPIILKNVPEQSAQAYFKVLCGMHCGHKDYYETLAS